MRVAIGPSSFAAVDKEPLEILEKAGIEVVGNPFGRRLTKEETIEHLKDIDGLIAGLEPLDAEVIESTNNRLKAIARVGIGMTNVDLDYAKKAGVKVSNTPDGPSDSVAELTLSAMLTLCRNVLQYNKSLHEKEWKKSIGLSISGINVFIIGYGRIGRKFAEYAKIFKPNFFVYDPYIKQEDIEDEEIKLVSLEEGLKIADVISLHAAGIDPILKEDQFKAMKDGVVILNSARGELIEEQALINAVKSQKVKGVWLDAFWQEPYTGELTEFDNVLLSPHAGTYTKQCRKCMEIDAVHNILRDLGI